MSEQVKCEKKRVYVASSWRNAQQSEIVTLCRELGFDVYDFKNPPSRTGFSWRECATDGKDWREWNLEEYQAALEHPAAIAGFKSDMDALQQCDICILVWPSGVSAAMEFGYAVGAGKDSFVIGMPREADLMVKMANRYFSSVADLRAALLQRAAT